MGEQRMRVRRIEDDQGSSIEPALDTSWGELTKLRWKAAVTALDSDLTIDVHRFDTNLNIVVNAPSGHTLSSVTAHGFQDAWTLLSGVEVGIRAARAKAEVS